MPEKGGIVLKRRFLFVWILIAALAACAGNALAQEHAFYGGCLRFHVIAADDSAPAQEMKLKIRDAVAGKVAGLFEDCEDAEDAWNTALRNEKRIEAWAKSAAMDAGYTGSVTAQAGVYPYEARALGSLILPEGDYRAVRIVIGEGQGQNWWCLLYPGLCMPEGYVPGMKVEFYSSVLRWLETVFGGGSNG